MFFALYFVKVHLHNFLRKKSQKVTKQKCQCFSYYFCLMIEGSGSGAGSRSVSLTNGSGSGRPKNIWKLNTKQHCRSAIRMDPHWFWSAGSGSRRTKMTHKKGKKFRSFKSWSATRCSLLRAEGLSCSLDVLYGGLGISEMQLNKKTYQFFFSCKFFSIFCHQNSGSGLNPHPESMNPKPKHWFLLLII